MQKIMEGKDKKYSYRKERGKNRVNLSQRCNRVVHIIANQHDNILIIKYEQSTIEKKKAQSVCTLPQNTCFLYPSKLFKLIIGTVSKL
jgi:hypothetical protein